MLQWERDRRLEEENGKLRRIVCGKEEAKQKREVAVAKKSLEEKAVMILAGGLSPAAKPFEPTPGASGATNGDKDAAGMRMMRREGNKGIAKSRGLVPLCEHLKFKTLQVRLKSMRLIWASALRAKMTTQG